MKLKKVKQKQGRLEIEELKSEINMLELVVGRLKKEREFLKGVIYFTMNHPIVLLDDGGNILDIYDLQEGGFPEGKVDLEVEKNRDVVVNLNYGNKIQFTAGGILTFESKVRYE